MSTKPDIDEMVRLVNEQAEITYEAQTIARKENKKLQELWQKLQDNCEHEWEVDRTQYDPCRTVRICKICRMNR
jgi:ribosomal protein L2